jgi:alkylation response protein AidB-like acyl-CoA dehydrogenase
LLDLLPSAEQQQIIDAAHALLADRMPVDRLRSRHEGDTAKDSWHELVEFGWFLIGAPEEGGGVEGGLVEEVLLAREAGRFLLPPSVLATTLAAKIAASRGNGALVGAIGNGTVRAGFVIAASESENRCLLIDAIDATQIVRVAADGISLFPIDAFEARQTIRAVDETVSLERARQRAQVAGVPAHSTITRAALVLLASVLVGLAEATLEMAVAYAKVREQFGRPIGVFQAVKHRCADMAVRAETAAAQVAMAALAEAESLDGAGVQIWSAVLVAIVAARENSASCIQIHGGMGFTWECHAHRYLKRAQLITQLLGGPRTIETRLLEQPATSIDRSRLKEAPKSGMT